MDIAIHNAVTTVWLGCSISSMSFPFRTELVAVNTVFGTRQAEWK